MSVCVSSSLSSGMTHASHLHLTSSLSMMQPFPTHHQMAPSASIGNAGLDLSHANQSNQLQSSSSSSSSEMNEPNSEMLLALIARNKTLEGRYKKEFDVLPSENASRHFWGNVIGSSRKDKIDKKAATTRKWIFSVTLSRCQILQFLYHDWQSKAVNKRMTILTEQDRRLVFRCLNRCICKVPIKWRCLHKLENMTIAGLQTARSPRHYQKNFISNCLLKRKSCICHLRLSLPTEQCFRGMFYRNF